MDIWKNCFDLNNIRSNLTMRVAILFFGEVRGNPEIWKNIYESLVKPNNADVFMHHVYYGNNFVDNIPESQQNVFKEFYYTNNEKKGVYLYPQKEMFEIFNPKKILIESRPDYSKDDVSEMMDVYKKRNRTVEEVKFIYHMIRSQAESRKKVNQIKILYEQENNFEYDVVVMTRLDICILKQMYFNMKPNTILAQLLGPYGSENGPVPNSVAQIYEQIIIGPSKQIDLVAQFYDYAPRLYKEFNLYVEFLRNEFYMAQHIVRCGLSIQNYWMPLAYGVKGHPNGLERSEHAFI